MSDSKLWWRGHKVENSLKFSYERYLKTNPQQMIFSLREYALYCLKIKYYTWEEPSKLEFLDCGVTELEYEVYKATD